MIMCMWPYTLKEADRQMGVLSWEELAMAHMKRKVAKEHRLGMHMPTTKKARAMLKEDENAGEPCGEGGNITC
jgi:hypothetical protein